LDEAEELAILRSLRWLT